MSDRYRPGKPFWRAKKPVKPEQKKEMKKEKKKEKKEKKKKEKKAKKDKKAEEKETVLEKAKGVVVDWVSAAKGDPKDMTELKPPSKLIP